MSAVKIALVGDKGRMGRLLTSRFSAAGCEVAGVDRPLTPETVRPAVQGADVVILCVPVEVLQRYSRLSHRCFLPNKCLRTSRQLRYDQWK